MRQKYYVKWRHILRFSPNFVPVYDIMMLWKFQVNWIMFDSARAFNIFFSFNTKGYGEDHTPIINIWSTTVPQPLTVEKWLSHRWKRIDKPFAKMYV